MLIFITSMLMTWTHIIVGVILMVGMLGAACAISDHLREREFRKAMEAINDGGD